MNNVELIEIVDEKGNPTGQVLERNIAHAMNLLHKEIGVFILNNKKQILLQKRSANKKYHPNKWGICAGHVEANEDNMTAMLRELKEEIGIDAKPNDLKLFSVIVKKRETNSHISYTYYMFLNKLETEFKIQKEELSEVKWFDIKELKDMIINSNDTVYSNNAENINMIEMLEKI